jgi:hypothetical protein
MYAAAAMAEMLEDMGAKVRNKLCTIGCMLLALGAQSELDRTTASIVNSICKRCWF